MTGSPTVVDAIPVLPAPWCRFGSDCHTPAPLGRVLKVPCSLIRLPEPRCLTGAREPSDSDSDCRWLRAATRQSAAASGPGRDYCTVHALEGPEPVQRHFSRCRCCSQPRARASSPVDRVIRSPGPMSPGQAARETAAQNFEMPSTWVKRRKKQFSVSSEETTYVIMIGGTELW